MGHDQLIKQQNEDLVRRQLLRVHCSTKVELAQATGLSTVTVGSIISRFLDSGEVLEGDKIPSTSGRPSINYIYNVEYRHAASIFVHSKDGVSYFSLAVSDMLGKERYYNQMEIPAHITVDLVEQLIRPVLYPPFKISALTAVFPGPEPHAYLAGSLSEKANEFFKLLFKSHDPIYINFENDINAAVYGWYSYNFHSRGCVVGMYYPRVAPPGAGIMIDGDIYHGRQSFAGEFALIPADVPWGDLNYSNTESTAKMIGKAIVTFCCTHAPDHIILYGDFWTPLLQKRIINYVDDCLCGHFRCNIAFSKDFSSDLKAGALRLSLDKLKKLISSDRAGSFLHD